MRHVNLYAIEYIFSDGTSSIGNWTESLNYHLSEYYAVKADIEHSPQCPYTDVKTVRGIFTETM